jgi:hypothetical protein
VTKLAEAPHQVSLDEIRTFDGDAQKLVEQYHAAGWSSRRSSKGHVIAYSPDGKASTSISRDSLRGRSGRNAAAPLKKWLRDQEAKKAAKGAAFGIADIDEATKPIEERFSGEVPVRIVRELAGNPQLVAYIEALEAKGIKPFDHRLSVGGVSEDVTQWFVADLVTHEIIIHSSAITLDRAYEIARESEMLPPLADKDETVKMFECDQCQERFENTSHLEFHRKRIHDGFSCKDCDHEPFTSGNSLAKHREEVHGVLRKGTIAKAVKERRWCEDCRQVFDTPNGLAGHLGRMHRSDAGSLPEQVLALLTDNGGTFSVSQARAQLPDQSASRISQAFGALVHQGRAVRVGRGEYGLPTGRDVTVTSPGQAVTPDRDTGGDVTGTSPVTALTNLLVDLPDGDTAVDMIAKIRAVVTPPLITQLREVTAERDRLVHDNELLTKELGDLKARFDLLKEALGA